MTEIKSIGSVAGPNAIQGKTVQKESGENFEALLKDAVGKVNTVQNEAEKAIQELSGGGDISNAVIAMEKADLSFQVMIEVRNKLISAYEEIMRLQV
ncbi:MAG: flagellar hook-basal body complex protein FliE [Deltaproteobacteria bacterium RBG_13_43_22]|nr:MAG: flagellar hook-basal body complex protein FliE [Deltaproteobacteria bacterium RBG_13_43_22]